MTDHLARVLELLEHATQQTDEPSYGREVPDGICWRCLRRPAMDDSAAGVCTTCRAVMLGDTDDEPLLQAPWFDIATHPAFGEGLVVVIDPEQFAAAAEAIQRFAAQMQDVLTPMVRAVADSLQSFMATMATVPPEVRAALADDDARAALTGGLRETSALERARRAHRQCPRHGTPNDGGLCRACAREQSRGRTNQHGHR